MNVRARKKAELRAELVNLKSGVSLFKEAIRDRPTDIVRHYERMAAIKVTRIKEIERQLCEFESPQIRSELGRGKYVGYVKFNRILPPRFREAFIADILDLVSDMEARGESKLQIHFWLTLNLAGVLWAGFRMRLEKWYGGD